MIILRDEHYDAIRRHGETDYPYECCGLLIGNFDGARKIVEETFPISNAREEASKRNRFLITPDEFSSGEQRARARGLDIVGFYHSHPDHPAIASGYDLEHAWPTYSYIIVSVQQGTAGDVLSWELEDDRSKFRAETLVQGEPQCR
jgi:proteasome lid subunit RPN8/RPN11